MSSPLKRIRKYCIACCAGSLKEIRLCTMPECPLYGLRFGHNPNRKGIGAKDGAFGEKSTVDPKEISKEEASKALGRGVV